MKYIISTLFILFLSSSNISLGQGAHINASDNNKYQSLSQEDVFVHYNTSLLFVGEYFFYKVYCVNTRINRPSKISKIAYVELVGEEGSVVFKHKLELIDSEGFSDFFIPTSVPSGNYKLLAYTRWMKNLGETRNLFQANISIVNPYIGNQYAISNTRINKGEGFEKHFVKGTGTKPKTKLNRAEGFSLTPNKKVFKKREAITLTLRNHRRTLGYGNYSLSVKKLEPVPHSDLKSSFDFNTKRNSKIYPKGIVYAPELSGSLITGQVFDKETNLPVKDINVAISVSGKNFFFRVATSNFNGNFRFWLDPDYESDSAIIQVIGDIKEKYKIELYNDDIINYSSLSFASFSITPDMKDLIIERSVYNQIENAYYGIKPDTIKTTTPKKPFTYYEKITSYKLDDFTRFSTMKDVFKELVKHVWTENDSSEKKVIKVRNYEYNEETEFLPLVFIDGVFVQEHGDLLEYNALKVDNISVLRDRYKFGTQDYQGVILIETIAEDFTNKISGDFLKNVNLFMPQQRKRYFRQAYEEKNNQLTKRTPDFRSQLFWEPSINLTSNEMNFQFFTSDNLGNYQISLEGFTQEGESVSIREIISVVE